MSREISDETKQQLVEMYRSEGDDFSPTRAARTLGIAKGSVYNILEDAGYNPRRQAEIPAEAPVWLSDASERQRWYYEWARGAQAELERLERAQDLNRESIVSMRKSLDTLAGHLLALQEAMDRNMDEIRRSLRRITDGD